MTGSWTRSWLSLLGEPHTETVNVLTHLLGAVVAISFFIYSYKHLAFPHLFGLHPLRPADGTLFLVYPFPHVAETYPASIGLGDAFAFASFFLAAFTCFGCSAAYHTSTSHSEKVSKAFNKLDYVGIVFLITGTYYPALYYAFYCQPVHRAAYIGLVTAFGAATTFFLLTPSYATPEYRRTRTWLFIGLGVSGVVPVVQTLLKHGWEYSNQAFGLSWLLLGGAFYIAGAVLYAERCPERFMPGHFDIYGNSHQIFHVACLLAALAHYVALCRAFTFRHLEAGGSCGAVTLDTVRKLLGEL